MTGAVVKMTICRRKDVLSPRYVRTFVNSYRYFEENTVSIMSKFVHIARYN